MGSPRGDDGGEEGKGAGGSRKELISAKEIAGVMDVGRGAGWHRSANGREKMGAKIYIYLYIKSLLRNSVNRIYMGRGHTGVCASPARTSLPLYSIYLYSFNRDVIYFYLFIFIMSPWRLFFIISFLVISFGVLLIFLILITLSSLLFSFLSFLSYHGFFLLFDLALGSLFIIIFTILFISFPNYYFIFPNFYSLTSPHLLPSFIPIALLIFITLLIFYPLSRSLSFLIFLLSTLFIHF